MTDLQETFGDVGVALPADGYVATVTIHRPPDNYFDLELIAAIADAYEQLDADPRCRAIVLGSEGKHFCAGAALHRRTSDSGCPGGRARAATSTTRPCASSRAGRRSWRRCGAPPWAAGWAWRCRPTSEWAPRPPA